MNPFVKSEPSSCLIVRRFNTLAPFSLILFWISVLITNCSLSKHFAPYLTLDRQSLGETYKSHLDNYIGYPIDAISGYCENTIKDLAINEVISINLSNIGSRKVNVFARVVKNEIELMKPKVIIVS
jgi:hypothetical protein